MALIVASCVLITYRGGSASYAVLYASIFIPMLSIGYLIHVYLKFRIYQHVDRKTIVKGSRINYKFDISNEDIVAYTSIKVEFENDKTIIDNFDTKRVYSLVPRETVECETTLRCKYCGRYEIGIKNAVIKDYLRIFSLNYKVDNMIMVNVLPRIIHLDRLIVAPEDADNKVITEYTASNQNIPDNQIKLYEPGEPAKRIHFKASARMNKLMSKRYTTEPKASLSLIVVTHHNYEDELMKIKVMDKIVEGTLAIVNYFQMQRLGIEVYYEKDGIQSTYVHDKTTFNALYEVCRENEFSKVYSADMMYQNMISSNPLSNYIMIITSDISEKFLKMCYNNRNGENVVNIIYIGEEDISAYNGLDVNIRVIKIKPDGDIEKELTGREEC